MKNRDKILVATRKGLFEFSRRAAGDWVSGPIDFIGDPVSMALRDPRWNDVRCVEPRPFRRQDEASAAGANDVGRVRVARLSKSTGC